MIIYNDIELDCTSKDIEEFKKSLEIKYTINDFSTPINGTMIENPTSDPEAKYYLLNVSDREYLQPHNPFESGFVPMKDDIESVIEKHIKVIVDDLVISKYKKVVNVNTEIEDIKKLLDSIILNGGVI